MKFFSYTKKVMSEGYILFFVHQNKDGTWEFSANIASFYSLSNAEELCIQCVKVLQESGCCLIDPALLS